MQELLAITCIKNPRLNRARRVNLQHLVSHRTVSLFTINDVCVCAVCVAAPRVVSAAPIAQSMVENGEWQPPKSPLVFALNGQRVEIPAAEVDPSMTLNDYIRRCTPYTGTELFIACCCALRSRTN